MSEKEVLIIGAGISGLSTAWWLARQGIRASVWEAEHYPGGKIRTCLEQGYQTEQAAGLLVNFRTEIDQLLQQTGLAQHKCIRDENLNRYVLHQGKLQPIPMQLPALFSSPVWSLGAKLRLITEILIPAAEQSGESVSSFIKRRLGREILDTAMDPFVTGTLASDPDLAEARAVLPRLTALEKRYGSLCMGMLINRLLKRRRTNQAETFSFTGGMSSLCQSIASSPGVAIEYGVRVHSMSRENGYWRVLAEDRHGRRECITPNLVLCTPAYVTASIIDQSDALLARELRGIEYSPVAVVHLGMKQSGISHPLDGTGFLCSKKEKLSLNGNLWMSKLFPERAPQGHALLTSYLGGARHPELLQENDSQLAQRVVADLAPLIGLHGEPDYLKVDRHKRALPLYHGRHMERIERIRKRVGALPGLELNANYADGVSVRECIYRSRSLALKVAASRDGHAGTESEMDPVMIARAV
jgi:oxygen-dependent protoporphyrinogen oxidase